MRQLQYRDDARQGVGKRSREQLSAEYVRAYTEEILDLVPLDPLSARLPVHGIAALLCVEATAEACHRSLVAQRLAERFGFLWGAQPRTLNDRGRLPLVVPASPPPRSARSNGSQEARAGTASGVVAARRVVGEVEVEYERPPLTPGSTLRGVEQVPARPSSCSRCGIAEWDEDAAAVLLESPDRQSGRRPDSGRSTRPISRYGIRVSSSSPV